MKKTSIRGCDLRVKGIISTEMSEGKESMSGKKKKG